MAIIGTCGVNAIVSIATIVLLRHFIKISNSTSPWTTLNLIVRDNSIFFLIIVHSSSWKMDIHINACFSSNIYLLAWKTSNKQYHAYLNLSHSKIYA
jgi:uncharacterized membrane protein YqhA